LPGAWYGLSPALAAFRRFATGLAGTLRIALRLVLGFLRADVVK
jgi:hypothetical protein